ncbi:PREDICTED: cathepsin L1-like isoform X1 [Cyprinodon variegatus]|uniref:cathepsin L1-like isoform X1 n=1 Tax=Cyprinodon variegatus TaxID=28743 RepID=UPI0007425116|nr:PREDICTED: cathepsin L1-like isoform X1 [Cyprinodon variegatus]
MQAVVAVMCMSAVLPVSSWNPQLDEPWELWKSTYNKTYDQKEEIFRRMVWEKNLKKIQFHNLEHSMGKHSHRQGMNQFGDMTNEEFVQAMNSYQPQTEGKLKKSLFVKPNFLEVPNAVDWREKGYVTHVKNQGHCGSCWAFGAIGSLEGQQFRKTGRLVSLSEQNLMDCSRPQGNRGCDGGWMDMAFQYVKSNGGLDSEESYPYVGKDQICQYDPRYNSVNVTGIIDISRGSERSLMEAVAAVGPVSVTIDASQSSFQFYQSGIYYEKLCSTSKHNHGVVVVGYGFQKTHDSVENYWIVKNSWGSRWGNNGYIYMAKDKKNNCGIASHASYPLV